MTAAATPRTFPDVAESGETFTLSIRMGNDAMRDGADIARALRAVAERLAPDGYGSAPEPGERGRVQDENGATVGAWEMSA
jgi:hypothetical protein